VNLKLKSIASALTLARRSFTACGMVSSGVTQDNAQLLPDQSSLKRDQMQ